MVAFRPGGGIGDMMEPLPGRTGTASPPAVPPPIAPPPDPYGPSPLKGLEGSGATSPQSDNEPLSIPAASASVPVVPPTPGTYTSQGSMGHPNPDAGALVNHIVQSLFYKQSVGGM